VYGEECRILLQRKKALAQKYDLSDHYNSRADVGELLAMLANVIPVSFCVLFYIFSSLSLLADLRIATLTTANRCVLADIYIGGQILLKKGGIIQIPTGGFHSDHNIWSFDVNEFDRHQF
jgi:hypothetical protein